MADEPDNDAADTEQDQADTAPATEAEATPEADVAPEGEPTTAEATP
jgi:hypothetical protein